MNLDLVVEVIVCVEEIKQSVLSLRQLWKEELDEMVISNQKIMDIFEKFARRAKKKNHGDGSSTTSTKDSDHTKEIAMICNDVDNNVVPTHLTSITTMDSVKSWGNTSLEIVDLKVSDLIEHEKNHQRHGIELITSNTFSSFNNLRGGFIGIDSSTFIASFLYNSIASFSWDIFVYDLKKKMHDRLFSLFGGEEIILVSHIFLWDPGIKKRRTCKRKIQCHYSIECVKSIESWNV
ncbi:hypothetical protein ZOSMA_151G00060 [Zostera marina]|uniref:Uncharacterized protein n=1 Tax=Zostera marina TaxID=29655 RepID=A0A0K9PY86_ZOSMR|nr:hypothetical protein ZOSMA_151G00060 [Zostera marina]